MLLQSIMLAGSNGEQGPVTLRLMSVSVESMSATPPPCVSTKIQTVLSTPQS